MSHPKDFDRLDDRPDVPGDRHEAFQAHLSAWEEYRKAYVSLAARDPDRVQGLPNPDTGGYFDPIQAMDVLRKVVTGELKLLRIPRNSEVQG